ncbi:unnamed protein product [Rotaria socialis]|uniref:UvrD-like helicase ATP-binding domain-containing protein n=2 Tax=Rotaria socialis TaxID=392032 RepID=A0A818KIU8_9BILA|nr:unnamed protein product [Rotaria socialis]
MGRDNFLVVPRSSENYTIVYNISYNIKQINDDKCLHDLNPEQKRAVTYSIDQSTLVLSGTGSGKTRVLKSRIVDLLKNSNINHMKYLLLYL